MRCSKCQRFLTREQTPHTPPLHKDEILFIKFQVQGFGCTTEIDYLCSRLFEVFFFAFYTRRCRSRVCKPTRLAFSVFSNNNIEV